jgi:YggT family protein
MQAIVTVLDTLLHLLQPTLFAAAVALAGVCAVDWFVRTRRIGPFSPVARFFRTSVEPLMLPVERRIVKAGGIPSHAPWWTLVVVVVGGIVVLSLIEFVRDQLAMLAFAASSGGSVLFTLIIHWAFALVRFALLWRVIASWVGGNPFGKLWRWAFVITDPMIAPLRRVLPAVGPFDISPIVAYFILGLAESLLVR